MAATVLFLAGPGGVFYNEQVLFPDGGALPNTYVYLLITDINRQHSHPTGRQELSG